MRDKNRVMSEIEQEIGQLEEERDSARRMSIAVQEMLAQVLISVGEPVVVPSEVAKANLGLFQINIDQNGEDFIFYVTEKDAVPDGEEVSQEVPGSRGDDTTVPE